MIGGWPSADLKQMVDLKTAMQAARADNLRKKRGGEDRKARPGGKLGVENFDPKDHVEKEVADTISMWLVLTFGTLISLVMRYVMMPGMGGPKSVLWFLPLTLVVIIPTLHRTLVPEPYKSRYTFGNWFRAAMLFIFTWLALSFILVNPPIGDIGAPDIAGKMTVVIIDGEDVLIDDANLTSNGDSFILNTKESNGDAWIVFFVNDNTDPSLATINLTSKYKMPNEIPQEMAGGLVSEFGNCTTIWDGLSPSQQNDLKTHKYDVCVAVNLGELQAGEYFLTVTLTENGDPWENIRVLTYTLTVV
jgi:hypothetical protein